MRMLVCLCSFLFPVLLCAFPSQPPSQKIKHVIYITLDGTRWQDFYDHNKFFKKLWQRYSKIGQFYGGKNNTRSIEVASIPISLPSYQSQMSGQVQPCNGNACGRIKVETFPEKFIKNYHWQKQDVAVFSSWWPIEFAVQHQCNTIYANTGNLPVFEPDSMIADPIMQAINQKQIAHPHPTGNRYDQYTFAQALHFFDRYQPKFLWISLVNADDAAHANNLADYHQALNYYDDALDGLFTYLEHKNLLSQTLIIVTTDHGRGDGDAWRHHGPDFPESKQTWAFVLNGELEHDNNPTSNRYSTLSIRPTIEKALL